MAIYQSLYDRLKNQHEAITQITRGVEEKHLGFRPEPGKWSIHDNIAHLAKYQPVFMERINAVLHLNDPIFNAYRAEYDSEFEIWRSWTTSKLLETLHKDRGHIFTIITGLGEEELNRIGVHKKRGRLDIVEWTEFFVLHEAHHIRTIFELVHVTETR